MVDVLLVSARLILAVVFLVAGLAKLADREGSREGMLDFGLPSPLATLLGILLPLTELAVAVALLSGGTAWFGAVGALGLLLVFVAGIALNLARGRRPECRCFGQLSSSPIGWSTLARNGLLAGLAAFVVVLGPGHPAPSLTSWLDSMTGTDRLLLFGLLVGYSLSGFLFWLLFQLLGQQGRILVRLEELERQSESGEPELPPAPPHVGRPLGSPAPAFSLTDLRGGTRSLADLLVLARPVMLVFTDPGCGPCTALMPELGRWQERYQDVLTIALVSRGSPEANRAKVAEHDLKYVLLQQGYEVADSYEARGTPSAVLVRPDGTIGSGVYAGADQIRNLVRRSTEGARNGHGHDLPAPLAGQPAHQHGTAQQVGPLIGAPAPELSRPDLGGRMVGLSDFRGQRTLVLFWNPGCGFCQRMLPDLKAWDRDPPTGAPSLLVVTTGTPEANRELDLRSTVVLDADFSAGRSFGAHGTPMAVLVDEQGNIASSPAAGADAVFALAGGRPSAV